MSVRSGMTGRRHLAPPTRTTSLRSRRPVSGGRGARPRAGCRRRALPPAGRPAAPAGLRCARGGPRTPPGTPSAAARPPSAAGHRPCAAAPASVRHGAGELRQTLRGETRDDRSPHPAVDAVHDLDSRKVLLARHDRPGETQSGGGEGQVASDYDTRREQLLPDRRAEQVQRFRQGQPQRCHRPRRFAGRGASPPGRSPQRRSSPAPSPAWRTIMEPRSSHRTSGARVTTWVSPAFAQRMMCSISRPMSPGPVKTW